MSPLLGALGDITTRVGPDATYAPVRTTLFVLLLAACGWVLSRRVVEPGAARFMGRLFLAAFAVRLVWGLFLMEGIPTLVLDHHYLSRGFLNDDGMLYDRMAWNGLQVWRRGGNPLPAFWAAPGYVSLTMFLYGVFGHNVFVVLVVNSFLGALVPSFIHEIARGATGAPEARLAALLCAFFPELVMWSGSHMKDPSVVFAFVAGLWAVLRLRGAGRRAGVYLAVLLACAVWLSLTRFYYVPLLGIALFLHTGRGRQLSLGALALRGVVAGGLLALMLALIARFIPRAMRWTTDPVEAFAGFYGNMVQTGSEGSFYALLEPPLSILLFPLALAFVALMPFILWTFLQPEAIYYVMLPATLVWYVLMPFSIHGLLRVERRDFGRVIFAMVVLIFVLLAVSGSGLSTSGRTRLPVQPLLMIYAAVGLRALRLRASLVRPVLAGYAVTLGTICLAYLWAR